jgi:hypothetical protein
VPHWSSSDAGTCVSENLASHLLKQEHTLRRPPTGAFQQVLLGTGERAKYAEDTKFSCAALAFVRKWDRIRIEGMTAVPAANILPICRGPYDLLVVSEDLVAENRACATVCKNVAAQYAV